MKKKLNLLWNLKFNFFSVAERPLTFFAYFLNAKKVGRRRLVISPAKAGAFLFSHTRLPFPPRPLLPFGRISPAAKPGWPVIGPTGAAILPFPSRLRRAGAPTAKPRRLSPFGSISLRETALAGRCPRRGQRARYPIFASLKCGPAYSRGVCRGTFLCSTAGPALAPRRSAPFHPKTIVRFRMSVSPEFSVFFICPPPFFLHRLRGAPIHKNPRRGYPAADLTPFQFPDTIFPSPTPEAVRPPPRRHIFLGFRIAINNFFFPSLIGVVIQLLLRTLPRMPKKESAPAFLFCFAPKGSFLPVLHSLFSLPLTFHVF